MVRLTASKSYFCVLLCVLQKGQNKELEWKFPLFNQ